MIFNVFIELVLVIGLRDIKLDERYVCGLDLYELILLVVESVLKLFARFLLFVRELLLLLYFSFRRFGDFFSDWFVRVFVFELFDLLLFFILNVILFFLLFIV